LLRGSNVERSMTGYAFRQDLPETGSILQKPWNFFLTSSYGVHYSRDVILRRRFGLIKRQFWENPEILANDITKSGYVDVSRNPPNPSILT
jgi:hypothetical protein